MTTPLLEKYISLITQFVGGQITVSQFEVAYLDLFKNETEYMSEFVYNVLNNLFLDVDAYCHDPNVRDKEDLSEKDLLESAKIALKKLKAM
jgi:hypothetical protein